MAKRNTISGISINSSYIAIATADLDEGVILNMSIQPLDIDIEDFWERVAEGFDTLFDDLKFKGENVSASLPAEFAIIKTFEADPLEDDYDEFLSWELSQQIVGNLEDYVFDYESLNLPGENDSHKFFLTAYRKETVDKVSSLLKSKKQHPVVIEPDAFSLINIFELNYPEILPDPTLLVFSEVDNIRVILTKDGNYIDMYNKPLKDDDVWEEELKILCDHIISVNQNQIEGGSLKVFFSGDDFSEEENINKLKEIYPESQLLLPFNKIKNLSGWNEEDLQKYLPRLAVAVGLAIRDADQI